MLERDRINGLVSEATAEKRGARFLDSITLCTFKRTPYRQCHPSDNSNLPNHEWAHISKSLHLPGPATCHFNS